MDHKVFLAVGGGEFAKGKGCRDNKISRIHCRLHRLQYGTTLQPTIERYTSSDERRLYKQRTKCRICQIVAGISLAWIRAIGEFGANVMVAYNPKTISIQLWEYNALGGLKLVMPGVLIVLIFSFASLAFWCWIMNLRRRTNISLISPTVHDHN